MAFLVYHDWGLISSLAVFVSLLNTEAVLFSNLCMTTWCTKYIVCITAVWLHDDCTGLTADVFHVVLEVFWFCFYIRFCRHYVNFPWNHAGFLFGLLLINIPWTTWPFGETRCNKMVNNRNNIHICYRWHFYIILQLTRLLRQAAFYVLASSSLYADDSLILMCVNRLQRTLQRNPQSIMKHCTFLNHCTWKWTITFSWYLPVAPCLPYTFFLSSNFESFICAMPNPNGVG